MRWSRAYIPTLRDDPADAEAANHRLLVRGGFVRRLMAGSWSLLPLGKRVVDKVEKIIREEMNRIGGQEMLLPVVHPGEVWKQTGRWDDVEGILVKFKDRRETDLLLAMTHEEIFTLLATELASYRQLPQLWYHLQTKFRDEPRPKGGLLRVREFTMKDSYSFDLSPAGLDVQFEAHRQAYAEIFRRLGMKAIPVHASSGTMGGKESVEFMVESSAGEDDIVVCPACGYAANTERATSGVAPIADDPWPDEPEPFATPGIRTIASLAGAFDFAQADRQIKTLAYVVGGELTLLLLRGDHELMEQKLVDALGTFDLRPAQDDEIVAGLGAHPGSLGAVGVSGLRVVADPALQGRSNMVTGANRDDQHLRGVDVSRDIPAPEWIDLRLVRPGDPCVQCGQPVEVKRSIEVGHIFKLGTKYAAALGATVTDEVGEDQTIWMGSYGIGVGRNVAAIVESHFDEKGIVWPVSVAPYEVVVTVVKMDDTATVGAADEIYQGLRAGGIDAIIDDRDERPGVKFADAELIGIPYRVTVGPKGIAAGIAEVTHRVDGSTEVVPLAEVVPRVAERIAAERL
ncbi:MAG: proline--tRNA ligase [Actinobacteria bacterium RBG_16_68_21]|nr:MAG: proline--tRNA ligase [Actinobacteria bacterium RBG_16_68_21]